MCLVLTVRLSQYDATRAPEIAVLATTGGGLEVSSRRRLFRGPSGELNICEPDQGCGCSLLTDSAESAEPTWSMRPEVLPRLAAAVRAIRAHTREGFEFQALWSGEIASHEKRLSMEALQATIEKGEISSQSQYHVA